MSPTSRKRVLAIVLAGGEGKRLMPLTADRAKPAVPFAGIYRLIDFALSNVVNSGYLRVVVLTQYKSHSLDRHVTTTWRMSTLLGNYVAPVPAQQRVGKHWYLGSADAIYQSLNLIHDDQPDIVVVVGADHVYRMDFSQMVDQHVASGAPVHGRGDPAADLAGRPVRRDRRQPAGPRAPSASSWRSRRTRAACPTTPTRCWPAWATTSSTPRRWSRRSPATPTCRAPSTTWAATSCPAFVRRNEAGVYDFKDNEVPGATDRDRGYWRDVGTMRSYYDAHMDVVSPLPVFNLYNARVADLHRLRPAAAGQARQGRRRHGPGRRGGAALARGRGVGRTGTPVGAVAGRPRRAGGGGRGLGADERRPDRRGRGRPQRDPRQGGRRAARRRDRRRPGARRASAGSWSRTG